MEWRLRDAKNNFSKVVQRARTEGPQIVTIRGKRAAVVLCAEDYAALCRDKPTLADHLLTGPAWDDELALVITSRSKTSGRDVDL